jgi:hypothetical protein
VSDIDAKIKRQYPRCFPLPENFCFQDKTPAWVRRWSAMMEQAKQLKKRRPLPKPGFFCTTDEEEWKVRAWIEQYLHDRDFQRLLAHARETRETWKAEPKPAQEPKRRRGQRKWKRNYAREAAVEDVLFIRRELFPD